MRATRLVVALILASASCADTSAKLQPETIVALERAALDRWGKGDPQGYLETYAPDVTYFDPFQGQRVDGLPAMREVLLPITGKVKIDRYEMTGVKVQRHGDAAVLSYNLASHARNATGDSVTIRWNSTAVYGRIGGTWKIIHSHWSFTRPDTGRAK